MLFSSEKLLEYVRECSAVLMADSAWSGGDCLERTGCRHFSNNQDAAQAALSRQVQDLEDEIGVDLLKRGPQGMTLMAEGKLFLDEVRSILKHTDESVGKGPCAGERTL